MVDTFTAMTMERRSESAKKPKFAEFMTTLAQEHSAPHSFMDMTHDMIMAEREKPSMIDAFTAMTMERRMDNAKKPKFVDFMTNLANTEDQSALSFMAWTNDMITAEREKPSMTDAFTAMTLERRMDSAKKPKFADFMTTLAQEHSTPHSFMDMTDDLIIAERTKPSFGSFMTNLGMPEASFPHPLSLLAVKHEHSKKVHPLALLAIKHESNVVEHQKEITFLNDITHPDYKYEPFTWTAMKAAHKYLTN